MQAKMERQAKTWTTLSSFLMTLGLDKSSVPTQTENMTFEQFHSMHTCIKTKPWIFSCMSISKTRQIDYANCANRK